MVIVLFLLRGKFQRTMTIGVASLLGGILGHGHRLFLSQISVTAKEFAAAVASDSCDFGALRFGPIPA